MDRDLLVEKMTAHGDKFQDLADYLGMARQTLNLKLRDKAQFRIDEVALIAERYNLTPEDLTNIFF